MSLKLYSTNESSDTSELPKMSLTSRSIASLIGKQPAIVKGDFIGQFDSEEEVDQFIKNALSGANYTDINVRFPSAIDSDGDLIEAEFRTVDGVEKSVFYFVSAI